LEAAGLSGPHEVRGEAPDLVAPHAASGAAALEGLAPVHMREQTGTIERAAQQTSTPQSGGEQAHTGRRSLSQRLFGR